MSGKTAAGLAATLVIGSGAFWYLHTSGVKIPIPVYRVARVIDGDTFETAEKQLVRLDGIDVPELQNCYGKEAKSYLSKLIENQWVYFKVYYRDPFNRLNSQIYSAKGHINYLMLKNGMGVLHNRRSEDFPQLENAAQYAQIHKLGVYSPQCTQTQNPVNPDCKIKGNVRTGRLYRFPGCGQYSNTDIQLHFGDRWFCTEAQAVRAGFFKASDCFEKKFNKAN